MKILFVGSEVMPFAATGGLGDVLGSLPAALSECGGGMHVAVVMPLHKAVGSDWRDMMKIEAAFKVETGNSGEICTVNSLTRGRVRYYFIENEKYFGRESIYGFPDDGERYAFFSAAVCEMLPKVGFIPDILHANDWHSALCAVYLKTIFENKTEYEKIKCIYTIHNLEYQGEFPPAALSGFIPSVTGGLLYNGTVNLMKAGIEYSDWVTTVSPSYAGEIQTTLFGHGLEDVLENNSHRLSGILNGIDYEYYNPETDPALAATFSPQSLEGKYACRAAAQREIGLMVRGDVPLLMVISRLAHHKGIDLIQEAIPRMLAKHDIQFAVLGLGEKVYEEFFFELERAYPGRVRALIEYDRELARRLYAAADIFIMPSRSEPCGLSQMIASRYGAIPVVREVGGLRDSIKNYDGKSGNGFTFAEYSARALERSIEDALALWSKRDLRLRFIRKIMETDFSWRTSAEKYRALYRGLLEKEED